MPDPVVRPALVPPSSRLVTPSVLRAIVTLRPQRPQLGRWGPTRETAAVGIVPRRARRAGRNVPRTCVARGDRPTSPGATGMPSRIDRFRAVGPHIPIPAGTANCCACPRVAPRAWHRVAEGNRGAPGRTASSSVSSQGERFPRGSGVVDRPVVGGGASAEPCYVRQPHTAGGYPGASTSTGASCRRRDAPRLSGLWRLMTRAGAMVDDRRATVPCGSSRAHTDRRVMVVAIARAARVSRACVVSGAERPAVRGGRGQHARPWRDHTPPLRGPACTRGPHCFPSGREHYPQQLVRGSAPFSPLGTTRRQRVPDAADPPAPTHKISGR